MKHLIATFAAFALLSLAAAHAEDAKPYLDERTVDLLQILPPPPADESVQTRQELADVLTIQVTRTPDMVERARADDEESVWRFADVLGPGLSQDKLPVVAAFFDRIAATEGAVVDPAKKAFARPRPFQLSDLARPVLKPSKSSAWPSGHATFGTLVGIELSRMVPEKRPEIMARAWEYGHNRVIAGMHFSSDVDMGRIAGSVISVELARQPDFAGEYEAARKELRAALGLGA